MTDREQIQAFSDDLRILIEKYIAEFDLTTAAAVGVLQIKVHELIQSALDRDDEEDEQGD